MFNQFDFVILIFFDLIFNQRKSNQSKAIRKKRDEMD
jgi:hypothetical protein